MRAFDDSDTENPYRIVLHIERRKTTCRAKAQECPLDRITSDDTNVVQEITMIPDDPALQNSGLIWRFSDADKYAQLSADEFLRFRPLSETDSLKLWEQLVYHDASPGHRHLTELRMKNLVQWPQNVSFRSESRDEEAQVVKNLQRDITASDLSEVIFFWHGQLAVKTDWRLFLDYWNDFCYPSDDSNLPVLSAERKAVAYVEDRWFVWNWQAVDHVFSR